MRYYYCSIVYAIYLHEQCYIIKLKIDVASCGYPIIPICYINLVYTLIVTGTK